MFIEQPQSSPGSANNTVVCKCLVSSVEGTQRNEIEDDYSFSTELGSVAAEAARSRRTFGENTGYGTTENSHYFRQTKNKQVA